MADVFTKEKRSEIMSAVRSQGNARTEMRAISIMREHGLRGWRRRYPLFGKPDFVFPKARIAVFIDGCFWHACPTHGKLPATNRIFWSNKLQRNTDRDRVVAATLRVKGWRVIRIWQHELGDTERVARRIRRYLNAGDWGYA
jgi:DNA mismatch endonuclease (patch repair protein)